MYGRSRQTFQEGLKKQEAAKKREQGKKIVEIETNLNPDVICDNDLFQKVQLVQDTSCAQGDGT